MSPTPPWRIRLATMQDAALLRRFHCAPSQERWHTDVEEYVQTQVLDWAAAKGAAKDDPRVLLLSLDSALAGVAAHERNLIGSSTARFTARKLHVVALASEWHGKSFEDGRRASDVLMTAAFADIEARDGAGTAVFGVVHRMNAASLRFCAKHGLVEEMGSDHQDFKLLLSRDVLGD